MPASPNTSAHPISRSTVPGYSSACGVSSVSLMGVIAQCNAPLEVYCGLQQKRDIQHRSAALGESVLF